MFGLNKYTVGIIAFVVGFLGFTFYVSSEKKEAINNYIDKQVIVVKELINGDQDAVDKQDNDIGDGSIIDRMYPNTSPSSGQERSQGNSNQAPDADTNFTNGLESNSRPRASMELPFHGIPEYTEEDTTYTEILPCTVEMPDKDKLYECINGKWELEK
jgi:hypothetical protein